MSDSIIVELDNSVAAKTYAANSANSAVAAASSVSSAATSAASALSSANSAAESEEIASTAASSIQSMLESGTYSTSIAQLTLEESTGYGVISGYGTTVSNGIITVDAGIVHLGNGYRYSTASTTFTPTADAANPRYDLIYISSTGVVSILTGTAVATPTVPSVPAGGLVLWSSLITTTGGIVLTDLRTYKPRYQNAGVINVKDCGAIGDGITDDTAAIQAAINYAEANNGVVTLAGGKTYLCTSQLNITKRIILSGNYGIIKSTAPIAIKVANDVNGYATDGTLIEKLMVEGDSCIYIRGIRNKIDKCILKNSSTAIFIEQYSPCYENVVTNCNLIADGGNSIGIDCETSDCIFTHITAYGQHTFIKNNSLNQYAFCHAWPKDSDYTGSVFFKNANVGNVYFGAYLDNCYSDTYETVFRIKGNANQPAASIKQLECAWSNKPSGSLINVYDSDGKYTFMRIDARLSSKPTNFTLCNVSGIVALPYTELIPVVEPAADCYINTNYTRLIDSDLYVCIVGTVNTGATTTLKLLIKNCAYFAQLFPYAYIDINGSLKTANVQTGGTGNADLEILCSQFTSGQGYVPYRVIFDRNIGYFDTIDLNS